MSMVNETQDNKNGNPSANNSEGHYDVVLRKTDEPPIVVNPESIVAAFVAVTLADVKFLKTAENSVANMNKYCQPRLWSVRFTAKFGAFACSADERGLPDVRGIAPALVKLGITQPFSLVINTMEVSFDGGKTKSKILAGFAFREKSHRILFPGNDGCIPG